jgi:hypothetical protein
MAALLQALTHRTEKDCINNAPGQSMRFMQSYFMVTLKASVQARYCFAPHLPQNAAPGRISAPQAAHLGDSLGSDASG